MLQVSLVISFLVWFDGLLGLPCLSPHPTTRRWAPACLRLSKDAAPAPAQPSSARRLRLCPVAVVSAVGCR